VLSWGRLDEAQPLREAYFAVEELERAAFSFFACRFSLRVLLAAVLELLDPALSLLAIVAPSKRKRLLGVRESRGTDPVRELGVSHREARIPHVE
jgi:hypothetical protein